MEKIFKLSQYNTNVLRELIAGATTFFAIAYVLMVIPSIVTNAGTPDNPMPFGAVFLATIISSAVATLFMGLFANVPYVLAPGLGLASFVAFTVCGMMGFTWQQALAMVFLCGIINIIVTVTNIRRLILKSIPETLQLAISGGIGIFIGYIGIKNANLLKFSMDAGTFTVSEDGAGIGTSAITPGLASFASPEVLLAIIGFILLVILTLKNVKGGILIGIIVNTIIGIPMGVTDLSASEQASIFELFSEMKFTFGAAFGHDGMLSLFNNPAKIPIVIVSVFSFSLSDMFDTIGVFVGTSKKTGIFSEEELHAIEERKGGKRGKLEKALFSDAVGTCVGSIFGATNVTTYIESTAGIGAGGRTGLTSVASAVLIIVAAFFYPLISVIPMAATAPVLILVGIMMLSSFQDIKWSDLSEAVPAFFAGIFMALCYNISYGIGMGFIFYCITKLIKKEGRDISLVLWICTLLFIANFILLSLF